MARQFPAIVAVFLLAACSGSDDMDDMGACGDGGDTYTDGLSRVGESAIYAASLMADPGPPDKGDNLWTVSIIDNASSEAVTGASVVAAPFMPEHGHGTSPAEYTATESDTPGTYDIDAFDLFMGGTWEVTLSVTGADDRTDDIVYTFCIEG